MRILITGSSGMLGRDLTAHLEARHQVVPADLPEVDITDPDLFQRTLDSTKPDAVIHAAAFTAVDECETRRELAFRVNGEGTRNVALACRKNRVPLLYISTDYVFDGEKETPYLEDDAPHPINVYGHSKLQGEKHISALVEHYWIVRTSWLFGPMGKNFVRAILEKARLKGLLQVVDDQVGAPTYTMDLAEKLEHIVERGGPGIYHVTNRGDCSWFEFAEEIIQQAGLTQVKISPVPTSASGCLAPRPRNSRLANTRLQRERLELLPPWQDALHRYLLRAAQGRD